AAGVLCRHTETSVVLLTPQPYPRLRTGRPILEPDTSIKMVSSGPAGSALAGPAVSARDPAVAAAASRGSAWAGQRRHDLGGGPGPGAHVAHACAAAPAR